MTKQEIEKKLEEVRSAIAFSERMLRKKPDGRLFAKHTSHGIRYYQICKGENTGHYLGKDKQEIIRLLEEKFYYSEMLRVARQEEQNLLSLKTTLEAMMDFNSVFLSIPAEMRHLIFPYEQEILNKNEDWICIDDKKPVPHEIRFKTQNGEYVRSKSELIIADRLKAAGVSYIYEDPLILSGNSKIGPFYIHPDFKVQNARTGKVYYWEHFGMLDNESYCISCQEKLESYAQYGYFPGENLIITSESRGHSLNLDHVDCLIERYLK